ncbi:MAG: hypothetical protein IJU70_08070 [Lentisphaeria bacterium]|nr:hypothetical protein [Lentisphaeria bacterium]
MKYLLELLSLLLAVPLFAAGALRIADASRAGVPALNALALRLALRNSVAVSIDKVTPNEAAARLAAGRADLIVLEHGNLPAERPRVCRLFAAEVLGLYVNAANGMPSVELRDLKLLLTSTRPNWRPFYPRKETDIHRYGLKERAAGYRLAESLLGAETLAQDIFAVGSTEQVMLLAGNDPEALGFGVLSSGMPAGVKVLEVNGVPPTRGNIASGKYLMCWRYYVLGGASLSQAAKIFLEEMKTASFAKELESSGFFPL